MVMQDEHLNHALRRGWTTGACAAAAAKAAASALLGGVFPDPVTITLPQGQTPAFALAMVEHGDNFARAGIIKDAGDDPDVTHGVLVIAKVWRASVGEGIVFHAGPGVGMVTRPGLPLPPGEPAINPAPRAMIAKALAEVAGTAADFHVEIAIPGGEALALRTLNPRLGIIGGLSVLGTTGIVVPYSCAAWIDSIHRGIDVARACGLTHVAGATGSTSEAAIKQFHGLPEAALIEMGDFVGGMLKYLRRHPVSRLSIAGGFGKMTKLGQGLLDLHSKRGEVDRLWLSARAAEAGASSDAVAAISNANSALHARELDDSGRLSAVVAARAWETAASVLRAVPCELEIAIFDRSGGLLATTGFKPLG